jgi:hypothetical protein
VAEEAEAMSISSPTEPVGVNMVSSSDDAVEGRGREATEALSAWDVPGVKMGYGEVGAFE